MHELRECSFVTLTNNNRSFKIHRLLQEVIRLTINSNHNNIIANLESKIFGKEYWLNEALHLIENKFDFNYLQVDAWNSWKQYLTHARTIAEHAITKEGHTFNLGIKLYAKTAMFTTHVLLDGENSVISWLKLLQLIEKHDNSKTNPLLIANIKANLGVANRLINNDHHARKYLKESISIYLQARPEVTTKTRELTNILRLVPLPDNTTLPDAIKYDLSYTLTQLGNLCKEKYSLKKYTKAALNYNKAIAIFSELKNIDVVKYGIMDTLYNLGASYIASGRFDVAEAPLKASKELADKIYVGHQQQALTCLHLGRFNNKIGKFKEADKLFTAHFHIMSRLLPKEHSSIINTIKIYIGYNAYMLGDIKRAKTLLEEALSQEYVLNIHYQWLVRFYLSRIYESIGKHAQAINLLKESLHLVEKHYKEKIHAFTAFQISRAEFWTKKNNNVAYCQEALEITKKIFGKNHYQTARYHFLLGQALANKQQMKQAKEQYELALIILKEEKINHPNLFKFHKQNLELLNNVRQVASLKKTTTRKIYF
jgi:tetratricopeptide (TPR) repeat protein